MLHTFWYNILSITFLICGSSYVQSYSDVIDHVTAYITIADLIPGAQYDLRVLARTKQGWPNISETQFDWTTVTMPSPESNQFTIKNVVDIQVLIVNASIIKVSTQCLLNYKNHIFKLLFKCTFNTR